MGSLGEAVSGSGSRTVVFRVSGTIEGKFNIRNDKITIAGQTAPGDGICIKGSLKVSANDVIIRYIRVRANPAAGEVDAIDGESYTRMSAPWDAMPIKQETPEAAYQAVLEHAGCSLPNRDAVDRRIIEEVRKGTATCGNNGIITRPSDVGGWPPLKSGTAPGDSDHDGMLDAWEKQRGLNPNDASDGAKDRDGDGYTNVEEYINGLVTSRASQAAAQPSAGRIKRLPGSN